MNQVIENDIETMQTEYNFRGGRRGKHYQAYRQGHTVQIQQSDGMVTIQQFRLEEGTVMLDPEVRKYFPDSETVNQVLRALIALIPKEGVKQFSG